MRPAYAYLGIGIVFILALVAFINPSFMSGAKNTSGTITSATNTSPTTTMTKTSLKLSSSAFTDGASIPSQYTCDGAAVSPPLTISGAPEGTKGLAIIMEDPDVPKQLKPDGVFLHWVLFNIPGSVTELVEDAKVGTPGANGAGKNGFAGPCPPAQYQPNEHRYIFTLYALDMTLALKAGASKDEVVKAMDGHILAQTQLIGKYKRK